MSRKKLFAATVLAATALGGAAFADANHHGAKPGPGAAAGMAAQGGTGMMGGMSGMMDMMQQMHGRMMGGGMMGGMGQMHGTMMQMFDADGDGTVTAEELRAGFQAKLTEYDSDGDGTLSISEFETLHSAMIRKTMVDRFQHLDADGDGSVTADEISAVADTMERMQNMRARMMQTQPGNAPAPGMDGMMTDN